MVELLAPAGSREAFIAAVESGADAVYLAGSMFGARAYASNFEKNEMCEIIRFAHLRGVYVHVTVNTIVDDTELPILADYLRFLYEAGADALLVQDLGVAALAKELIPDMPLHASTQMTVHNLEGVLALQELGFSRVVLSREVSLKDIRYICANCQVEIEVFMHGALCVCYSGQCLMSSLIGGRSGNRGRCAQPCRLPYALVDEAGTDLINDGAGKYLLSTCDLNTIDILPELIDAGVSSLKIEGRMKRPEYVATVVSSYRKAIDSYLSGAGYSVPDDIRKNLEQIFNRGFTTAYLKQYPGKHMISDRRPNNRGLLIGRVTRYDKAHRFVALKLTGDLSRGDQVDFWVKVGGRVTVTIQDLMETDGKPLEYGKKGMEVVFPVPDPVQLHDRAFKVYDAKLMEKIKPLYAFGAPVRKIPVEMQVFAAVGKPMRVLMKDINGNHIIAETNFIGEEAKKHPVSEEIIKKQISRLGASIFSLKHLEIDIHGNVMIPISEMNDVRRRAVEAMEEKRLQAFSRSSLPPFRSIHSEKTTANNAHSKMELIVSVDSVEKVKAALEAGADNILFGGESYSHEVLSEKDYYMAWELTRNKGKNIFFNTPRIVRQHQQKLLEQLLSVFKKFAPKAIYVHNIGTLRLVKKLTNIPVHTDYSLISYNHRTLEFLKEHGICSATLSPELNMLQVEKLAERNLLPLECIVHGKLELMVSEYCVTGSFLGNAGDKACSQPCRQKKYYLKDRKNILFPLVMDQFCHMHVLNGMTLSMLPHVNKFSAMGISRIRIEGKAESAEKIKELVQEYRMVMQYNENQLMLHENDIKNFEGNDITRGHYFRGVQ